MVGKKVIAVAMLAISTGSAWAQHFEPVTRQALTSPTTALMSYVNGLNSAYGWINALNQQAGKPMLYCVPPRLALTFEQLQDILRRFAVGDRVKFLDTEVGLTLFLALVDAFPCPAGAPPK